MSLFSNHFFVTIIFDRLGFSIIFRSWQSFLISSIIRNILAILLRAMLLGYLGRKRYPGLKKKVRNIEE